MDHRLILSYDGGAFAGWQRQENALAVQEVLEGALSQLVGAERRVVGASRTDAGVHARGQVAHFSLDKPFPLKGLVHGCNHLLPPTIRVLGAERMPPGFHARRDALGKEYTYRLARGRVCSPLDQPYAMEVVRPLDVAAMRAAMACLPGNHDFGAFALKGGSHTTTWRRLYAATIDDDGRALILRFHGAGFLRGMVRALVGTLVQIGHGDRPVEDMARLIEPGHRREEAGTTVVARGLCLERVFYPPRWQKLDGYSIEW
jgi:tRNA pseudouridine38-40 synthase